MNDHLLINVFLFFYRSMIYYYLRKKQFFECLCHNYNIFAWFVVNVTVGKHRIEILDTFFATPVIRIFQPFFYCAQIHWLLDNFVIILIDGGMINKL